MCPLAAAEFRIPSLKSGAEFVIKDVYPHLQGPVMNFVCSEPVV